MPGTAMRHYVNDQPRQKRTSCELFLLGFGLLCITQAILNISLRLTLNCSGNHIYFNTTDDRVHMLDETKDITIWNKCQKLQEKVKALTRDNEILERRNNELKGMFERIGWKRQHRNFSLAD